MIEQLRARSCVLGAAAAAGVAAVCVLCCEARRGGPQLGRRMPLLLELAAELLQLMLLPPLLLNDCYRQGLPEALVVVESVIYAGVFRHAPLRRLGCEWHVTYAKKV